MGNGNNQNYFYLYPFFGNSPTGQTRRRIFTHDGSNDADSRKDVPFWGTFHMAHISAAVQPIFTKFGMLVQFDPLDRSGR